MLNSLGWIIAAIAAVIIVAYFVLNHFKLIPFNLQLPLLGAAVLSLLFLVPFLGVKAVSFLQYGTKGKAVIAQQQAVTAVVVANKVAVEKQVATVAASDTKVASKRAAQARELRAIANDPDLGVANEAVTTIITDFYGESK